MAGSQGSVWDLQIKHLPELLNVFASCCAQQDQETHRCRQAIPHGAVVTTILEKLLCEIFMSLQT